MKCRSVARGIFSFLSGGGGDQASTQKDPEGEKKTPVVEAVCSEKVAQVWDEKGLIREASRKLNWMDYPVIEASINERISGDPRKPWLIWVQEKYCPVRGKTGLVLGCGDGTLERAGIHLGLCDTFEAFDISPQSVASARETAEKNGVSTRIRYEVCDINALTLPQERYDLAFCAMSLHHFAALEGILEQISRSLVRGGLFIFNEYVGPSQFQWSDKQLQMVNDLLRLLPDRYRRDLSQPDLTLRKEAFRPTRADMNRIDPSEAIRSEAILPLVERYFAVLERVDYGGTLLQLLLHNIVGNFDPSEEADVTLLRLLYYFEILLIETGVLTSDFTLVVAKAKS